MLTAELLKYRLASSCGVVFIRGPKPATHSRVSGIVLQFLTLPKFRTTREQATSRAFFPHHQVKQLAIGLARVKNEFTQSSMATVQCAQQSYPT